MAIKPFFFFTVEASNVHVTKIQWACESLNSPCKEYINSKINYEI